MDRFLEHGFERHVSPGTANGVNEFAKHGITTPQAYKDFALKILNDPGTEGLAFNKDGSHLYFYNRRENIFIAIEPEKGGTMFPPKSAEKYFKERVQKALNIPELETVIKTEHGGFKALNEAFKAETGHLAKIKPLGEMLGAAFEGAGGKLALRGLGRAAKFIPLAGTAVTFAIGRAEAADLREKAYEAVLKGTLPAEALEDYETVLKAHQLQVNLDFAGVYFEADVQRIYNKFSDVYGLDLEMHKALTPPSLIQEGAQYLIDRKAGHDSAPPPAIVADAAPGKIGMAL